MKTHQLPPVRLVLNGSPLAFAAALWLAAAANANAQTQVYSEDFDVDHTANFVVNVTGSGYSYADAFFDYSTIAIPPAPHSTGGTTRGLKLAANLGAGGVFPAGVSISPLDFGITENFEMRFDMWLNYDKSGNGSTEVGGAGYGTAGTSAQVVGQADSIFIGATTDGGSSADYRVYAPAHQTSYQDADYQIAGDPSSGLVYFCGSRNNTATYYVTNFPATPVPEAQTNLFPRQTGTVAPAGTVAFKWHDVSLKKVANIITYRIDGVLIATVNATDAGTLGGTNIVLTFSDISAGGSTDVDATNVLFALFDNIRITNFPTVVSVDAISPNAWEAGPSPGTFMLTRSSAGTPLTVNYTLSGSAVNGVDYNTLSGSATFGATDMYAYVDVTPIDDSIAEPTESVTLTVADGPGYSASGSATITIADNDTPTIDLSPVQVSMYERLTNDYVRFRLTRRGDLNAGPFDVNITYGGAAAAGVDFTPVNTVTFNWGDLTTTLDVHPIDNALLDGSRTFTVSLAPGTGYAVGTNTPLPATIVDDERPPETVLWSDNLQTDTSANWTVRFGSTNSSSMDYAANWAMDFSMLQYPPIPPAPHSGTDTHGLLLTVNKGGFTTAAGLNLYPTGKSFSGNYALRFDMYLIEGIVGTTEYALFGINHSGTKTNWFRNNTGGVGPGWDFDGLFYDVESDGAALGDYALFSGPNTGIDPTPLNDGRSASTLTSVFKSPPWTPGAVGGGAAANLMYTETPCWADVEVSQIGNIVTLTINKTVIFAYTNTTPYTSGNIMLGYDDAYDSDGSPEASVIYANARVVSLAAPVLLGIQVNGGNAEVTFSANAGDVPGQFQLQAAPAAAGPYTDVASTISPLGGGSFKAAKALGGDMQFYRVKRIY